MNIFELLFGKRKEVQVSESRNHVTPKVESAKPESKKKVEGKEVKFPDVPKPNTEIYPVIELIDDSFSAVACQVNMYVNMKRNDAAVQSMNQLFQVCYGANGHSLLNISLDNCQPIGLAFTNIAILLDFNDRDMNSVAAENAFYCLSRSFIAKDNTFVTPAMFTLLLDYSDLLKDKLISTHCSWHQKKLGMPIGMMLGGNPFNSPNLADFRQEAIDMRVCIMSYLVQFFYDVDEKKYLVPTDMPYWIPAESKIQNYLKLSRDSKMPLESQIKFGEEYFYLMFTECEDTLNKCR